MANRVRLQVLRSMTGLLPLLAACGGDGPPSPPVVSAITIEPSGPIMTMVGLNAQVTAVARDATGNPLPSRRVTWTSAAEHIARVSETGVVTGVSVGATVVTAASEGRTATVPVTILPAPVSSVVVTPPTARLEVGQTATLSASTLDPIGGVLTGRAVRWTSSAPEVASVEAATGVVRALRAGTATITATSEGRSGTATITVVAAGAAAAPDR